MKNPRPVFKNRPGGQRGMALIVVLALLVLMTAMVVGFLVISGLEMNSSVAYKASSNDRLLADTVVNLVQGQINEATSQGSSTAGTYYSWASQPGAIWSFNKSGGVNNIYKLYSSPTLTTSTASAMNTSLTPAGTNDMPPTSPDWSTEPALWVDLNASATDAGGNVHYPILNPAQAANVDGYSISTSNSFASSDVTTNDVPMPVQWLYVLQNGQIIAPDSSSTGTSLTFANAATQPSSANPIVGRVAFWTDDETCKVNINTAGGDGIITSSTSSTSTNTPAAETFWDTPHYATPDDSNLAVIQPTSGEFQRYPGHPGTVALNNILNGLGWNLGTQQSAQNFYQVTPRYAFGGSKGASLPIPSVSSGTTSSNIPLTSSPANRLYPSVGEMLFTYQHSPSVLTSNSAPSSTNTQQQIETARFFLTAHSQVPEVNLFGQPRVSMWPVWTTSTSPSSVDTSNAHLGTTGGRTAIDKVLAFCATAPGTTPSTYYFTRYDNTSNSCDIGLTESNGQQRNQMLLNYLDYFTSQAIPGYGGSFSAKSYGTGVATSLQSRQILTEIFDYIRTINMADTSQLGSITTGSNATTNTWAYAYQWQNESSLKGGYYQVAPTLIDSTNIGSGPLSGWVSGTNTYQGIGAYPRLNEVALQFVALGQGALPTSSTFPSGVPAIPLNSAYNSMGNITFASGDPGTIPGQTTGTTTYVTAVGGKYYAPGSQSASSLHGNVPLSTTAIQGFILLDFTQPAQMMISNGVDNAATHPFMWVEISGLNAFKINGHNLGFPSDDIGLMIDDQGGGALGGSLDEINFFAGLNGNNQARYLSPGIGIGTVQGADSSMPFYSAIIPVNLGTTFAQAAMSFTGAPITVKLYDGSGTSAINTPAGSWTPSKSARLVQTYTINFGAVNGGTAATSTTLPVPTIASPLVISSSNYTGPVLGSGGTSIYDRWNGGAYTTSLAHYPNILPYTSPTTPSTTNASGGLIQEGDVVASMVLTPQWSDARVLSCANVPATAFTTHPYWSNWTYNSTSNSWTTAPVNAAYTLPWNTSSSNPLFAWAYNLTANESIYYSQESTSTVIKTSPVGVPTMLVGSTANLGPGGPPYPYAPGVLNPKVNVNGTAPYYYSPTPEAPLALPLVPPTLTSSNIALLSNSGTNGSRMDWDNGIAALPDGPWINKVDEGQLPNATKTGNNSLAYFTWANGAGSSIYSAGASYFSPNREVPSPGMLGSLPTGVDPTGANPVPWQTLLFRPGPTGHPGATTPPDHLWLDLFWMPVAEPYAISQPLTSEGKINLNYEIEPFTYIIRNTAIRAVLNTQKISDAPTSYAPNYKPYNSFILTTNARYPINTSVTLQQFQDKFDGTNLSGVNAESGTNDIFRSASQICETYLVPQTDANSNTFTTASAFAAKWYDGTSYGLVGDNARERPYTNIYGLVTTKSNTYTVYYTVQSLKNAEPAASQNKWNESLGSIRGEYRGSTTIERYIDPNQSIPDFANSPGTYSLDGNEATGALSYYKWRIVENHQFAP